MDMFLPHGTRVLKTLVLKKQSSEDDDEDEEPEMKGKMKWNRGRRSRSTRSKNLKNNHGLENADLTKKNHGLKERRTREEEAAQRWESKQ